MHGAVVKLDALADADGTGSQHHYFLFIRQDGIVLPAVAGVEVSDVFARVQGVHHAEHRDDAVCFAQGVHFRILLPPQPADLFVSKAHDLRFPQDGNVPRGGAQALFHLGDFEKAV